MPDQNVQLTEVARQDDRARIGMWLSMPHVARWWGDGADRLAQFDQTPDGNHAVIAHDGQPVGYIRWETVDPDALQDVGLGDIPEGSIDCDLFIGEEGLTGQGIGPRAVELLCKRLTEETSALLVGFCTSVDNKPAHAAFLKVGCSNLTTYDDPAYGRCHVFVRWLR